MLQRETTIQNGADFTPKNINDNDLHLKHILCVALCPFAWCCAKRVARIRGGCASVMLLFRWLLWGDVRLRHFLWCVVGQMPGVGSTMSVCVPLAGRTEAERADGAQHSGIVRRLSGR